MKIIIKNKIIIIKNLLFLCATVLIFSACSSVKYNKVDFTVSDTLVFEGAMNLHTNCYYYDENSGNEYFINYYDFEKTISFYDYKTGKKINKIKLNNGINSYYVHNLDSIFLSNNDEFSEKNNIISLINSNGKLLANYDLSKYLTVEKIDFDKKKKIGNSEKITMKLNENPYTFFNFCFQNNTLFLQITPNVPQNEKYFYPTIAIVSLAGNSVENVEFIGNYPDFYCNKNGIFDAAYTSFVAKNSAENCKIINSFILSDFISEYKFSNEKNSTVEKKWNDFQTKNIDLASKNKGNYYPITKHYIGAIATFYGFKYAFFKYDKYRNVYYRIAVHSLENELIKSGENLEIGQKKQNWSIITTDEKFRIFDETVMPADNFYSPDFLITKDGIAFIKIENIYENNGTVILKNQINFSKQ